ncbi:MAG: hypothetical protein ACE361_06445 [Aureliella sp.]
MHSSVSEFVGRCTRVQANGKLWLAIQSLGGGTLAIVFAAHSLAQELPANPTKPAESTKAIWTVLANPFPGGMPPQMGGMGGMGGGMGGMVGGMGYGTSAATNEPIVPATPKPAWLEDAAEEAAQLERLRRCLRKPVSLDYSNVPLETLAKYLGKQCGIRVYINTSELDMLGVDPETPISFSGAEVPIESALDLILAPLDLSYRVREIGLEITTKDACQHDPVNRVYDMGWVISNTNDIDSLLNIIQQTVDPDSWLASGGTSTILPLTPGLVVSAPDSTHRKIERLLGQLATLREARMQVNATASKEGIDEAAQLDRVRSTEPEVGETSASKETEQ